MTKPLQSPSAWVNAAEASRTLGITRQTLYAYVSRGLVRSEAGTSATRERRYAREDIERLKRRAEERPERVRSAASGGRRDGMANSRPDGLVGLARDDRSDDRRDPGAGLERSIRRPGRSSSCAHSVRRPRAQCVGLYCALRCLGGLE